MFFTYELGEIQSRLLDRQCDSTHNQMSLVLQMACNQ